MNEKIRNTFRMLLLNLPSDPEHMTHGQLEFIIRKTRQYIDALLKEEEARRNARENDR